MPNGLIQCFDVRRIHCYNLTSKKKMLSFYVEWKDINKNTHMPLSNYYAGHYNLLGGKRDNLSLPLYKWKTRARTKNFLEEDTSNIKKIEWILLI